MGSLLRGKGWKKPLWMQVGVVVTWFASMFLGVLGYGIYLMFRYGEAEIEGRSSGFITYGVALASALLGVGLLFGVAALLPTRNPPPVPVRADT